jgi:hypothetical protein
VIGNPYAALLVMSVTAVPGIAIALRLPGVTRAPATASEPAMNGPAG